MLLSRQTESVRDHKFHSGYAHSSMDRGTLFRTCIKLKSRQRETVVHLSLWAFRKCVQKWSCVCFFKNKCPLSNFESRLLCFLPICEKAFFLNWLLAGISQIFLLLSKALLGSLLCFNCLLISWAICYKRAFEQPNLKSLIVFYSHRSQYQCKQTFLKRKYFSDKLQHWSCLGLCLPHVLTQKVCFWYPWHL